MRRIKILGLVVGVAIVTLGVVAVRMRAVKSHRQ
jgi:hypothetical protein